MKGWAGGVADQEKVYRRVRQIVAGQVCYHTDGDRVNFSQAAFNDPAQEPSLDRARLRPDPQLCRLSAEDGIVALQATAIRGVGPISKMAGKKPARDSQGRPISYDVDVVSDPHFGNCSHAVVVAVPGSIGGSAFKRLKDALARLASDAGWTVEPNTPMSGRRENPIQDSIRCLRHRLLGRS